MLLCHRKFWPSSLPAWSASRGGRVHSCQRWNLYSLIFVLMCDFKVVDFGKMRCWFQHGFTACESSDWWCQFDLFLVFVVVGPANSNRLRLLRLSEAAENLRKQAAVNVRTGKENDARDLLLQKKKVMQALDKAKARIELLDTLSSKLNEVQTNNTLTC